MDSYIIGRSLLVLGELIAMMGASILVFSRLPLVGRFPGDTSFQRDGFFFFPIVTCVLLSLLLTIAVNVIIRLLR